MDAGEGKMIDIFDIILGLAGVFIVVVMGWFIDRKVLKKKNLTMENLLKRKKK